MRMKRQLAYRTAAYAGIVTQVVFGLVLVAIFAAFYANGIKSPMTLQQVTTYIWLGQAFFAMTPYSVFPDAELREQIRDGKDACIQACTDGPAVHPGDRRSDAICRDAPPS